MQIRLGCGLMAAALAVTIAPPAFAQDEFDVEEAPISLMGCVQRETDYRRENNSGKGGFLGFGGGLGDEYVLVNASPNATGAFGDCSAAAGGEAYELTGSTEEDLEAFVGQRVAISGTRKAAEVDSATGRPTGGRQVGDDLRLFEVEVDSFRALAAPVQTGTVARLERYPQQEQPRVEQREERRVEADRAAAPGAEREQDVESERDVLPRTASPLAVLGLMGLLSFAGVAALRSMDRPRRL